MSLEEAKRLLMAAMRYGSDQTRALAGDVLGELEGPEDRARRLARERQQKRRSERDTSVTSSRVDPDACHADVTPRAGPGHGDVTLEDSRFTEKNAVSDDARHAAVTLGGRGGSPSLSLKSEILRESARAGERDTSVTGMAGVTVITPGARVPWPEDFKLTPELRAFAEQQGVTDVPDVFAKFRSVAIEKQWAFDARGWIERWKRFALDERRYQRKERERDSGRYQRVPEETQPAPYHGGSRKRAQDELREQLEYEANLRKTGQLPPLPTRSGGTP